MTEILAAHTWATNADLIADAIVPLGYLQRDWYTLDPTFGEGLWWSRWMPAHLVAHDLYKGDGVDFRSLPEADDTYDAAVFDPPYAAMGGVETSTIGDYNSRYGRDTAPKTPAAIQEMNDAGLAELRRVVRPGGLVLAKCMDYIWSGKLWEGVYLTQDAARSLGYRTKAIFTHVGPAPRPQPGNRTRKCSACAGSGVVAGVEGEALDCGPCGGSGREASTQQHPRNNASVLLVLVVPGRKRSRGTPLPFSRDEAHPLASVSDADLVAEVHRRDLHHEPLDIEPRSMAE